MIERTASGLRVTVPMVMSNALALLQAGCAILAEEQETIDLAGVAEADSSALAVLLAWLRSATAAQRQLRYINLPAGILALADLYGVDELLPFA